MKGCPKSFGHDGYIDAEAPDGCRNGFESSPGDMLLILAAKGSARSAFGIHAPTAVLMVLTAIPLMIGGR